MADPAAPPEPFSLTKWIGGFFNGVSNMKDIKTVIFVGFLVLAGFTIWKAYFVKTQQQTQRTSTTVTAQSGSHVVVEGPKQEMKSDEKNWQIGVFGGSNVDNEAFAGIILLRRF